MADSFFLAVFVVIGCFLASRAYRLISRGELNVKGVVYSRQGRPVGYWLTLIFAIIGTTFSFAMAAAGLAAMLSH